MKWRRPIVSLHPIKDRKLLLGLFLSVLGLLVGDLRAFLTSSHLRSTVRLRFNCSCWKCGKKKFEIILNILPSLDSAKGSLFASSSMKISMIMKFFLCTKPRMKKCDCFLFSKLYFTIFGFFEFRSEIPVSKLKISKFRYFGFRKRRNHHLFQLLQSLLTTQTQFLRKPTQSCSPKWTSLQL